MRDTETMIDTLAQDARPVRRLPTPERRVLRWLAIALPVSVVLGGIMGVRPDLVEKLGEPGFLIQLVAGLVTAGCAAFAAFGSCVPGAPSWMLWLPAAPLAVWVVSLGRQCIQDWLVFGPDGVVFRPDLVCLPIIAMLGLVPAVAMVVMTRRGAPLIPRTTTFLGALASAALAYVVLRLVHPQDAAFMVLVWQFGSVMLLAAAAGVVGRWLLHWPTRAAGAG